MTSIVPRDMLLRLLAFEPADVGRNSVRSRENPLGAGASLRFDDARGCQHVAVLPSLRVMTRAAVPKPRRRPKQARSHEIVRAIEEACLRILTDEGPDAVNTNRIAEVAGVNIASVYRYFPNKDAIMVEVYEQKLALEAEMLDALYLRAEEIDALSLERTIRLLVETYADHSVRLLALHEDFYRRHCAELDLGDRYYERNAQSWLAQAETWIASVLERHRDEACVGDTTRAAFLVVRALQGVVTAAVKDRPASLRDAAFREDVLTMLLAYVRGRAAGE